MLNKSNTITLSELLSKDINPLADWFLRALFARTFTPLVFYDDPSYLIQIRDLFFDLNTEERIKFRSLLLSSFRKWDIRDYPASVICDLAIISSYTKTIEALDYIRNIIPLLIDYNFHDTGNYDAVSTLFAVVAGFSPDDEVFNFFRRFYFLDSLDYKYVAQIFLGLCVCKPQSYSEYIPRLLNTLTKHSNYFRADIIFAEFVRIVGLRTIAQGYKSIDSHYNRLFLDYLCEKEWSPAMITLEKHGDPVLIVKPTYDVLGPDFFKEFQTHPLFPISELAPHAEDIRKIIRSRLENFREPVQQVQRLSKEFSGSLVSYSPLIITQLASSEQLSA